MEGDGQPLNLSRLLLAISNANDLTIEKESGLKVHEVAEFSSLKIGMVPLKPLCN